MFDARILCIGEQARNMVFRELSESPIDTERFVSLEARVNETASIADTWRPVSSISTVPQIFRPRTPNFAM